MSVVKFNETTTLRKVKCINSSCKGCFFHISRKNDNECTRPYNHGGVLCCADTEYINNPDPDDDDEDPIEIETFYHWKHICNLNERTRVI